MHLRDAISAPSFAGRQPAPVHGMQHEGTRFRCRLLRCDILQINIIKADFLVKRYTNPFVTAYADGVIPERLQTAVTKGQRFVSTEQMPKPLTEFGKVVLFGIYFDRIRTNSVLIRNLCSRNCHNVLAEPVYAPVASNNSERGARRTAESS
jgi:hypothetical protein